MKSFALLALALAVTTAPAFAGDCGSSSAATQASNEAMPGTIVDTAVSAGNFTTLVTAVKAAGLADTLSGPGPYTVFAPTDEAFAKLPDGTVEALLANPEQLREILLYHVVPGKVTASEVVKLKRAATAQGGEIDIKVADGSVMVNDASVIATDIPSSNGVIHVIDTVILPRG